MRDFSPKNHQREDRQGCQMVRVSHVLASIPGKILIGHIFDNFKEKKNHELLSKKEHSMKDCPKFVVNY